MGDSVGLVHVHSNFSLYVVFLQMQRMTCVLFFADLTNHRTQVGFRSVKDQVLSEWHH